METADQLDSVLAAYNPTRARETAERLRAIWLRFEPGAIGIKASQRAKQETVGIPVPELQSVAKAICRRAGKQLGDWLPLARLLWDEYGREGRVVAATVLGAAESLDPDGVIPILRELCRTCIMWEDADRLAMNALEPVVRHQPERWLAAIEAWLTDENKWVRRAAITVVARLPMKHPEYTSRCLQLVEWLLLDDEEEVRKAVSFAIRMAARGAAEPVRDFMVQHVPPVNPAATWVLCDAVRSMTRAFLPEFLTLLPRYEAWAADPSLRPTDRRSVESAVATLRNAQG